MFDASGIDGVEVFGSREITITGGDPKTLENRVLPVVSLGVGHFKTVDKAMALTHAFTTETGYAEDDIYHWLDQVRVVLPDTGVEHKINDAPDVVPPFLRREGRDIGDLFHTIPGSFLLPKSAWVLEGNHVWDSILRTTLDGIPWWERFFYDLKFAIDFIRDKVHLL